MNQMNGNTLKNSQNGLFKNTGTSNFYVNSKFDIDKYNFQENSLEEKEFLKNLGIRDFLKYTNRKKHLKTSMQNNPEKTNLYNEENYRSKSAKNVPKKDVFTQSVKNKIENTESDLIEKARGNIKINNSNEPKNLSKINDKIISGKKNNEKYNNNDHIETKLDDAKDNINLAKKNILYNENDIKNKDAKNDIFSDDDYKFIEMSKSQKRKLRNIKEQNTPNSNLSNENENHPTAHFNMTKTANNLNSAKSKIEDEKEQIFLRFYEDEFNKLPNVKSDSYNKNINFSKTDKNVFEDNLFNRENTLNKNNTQTNYNLQTFNIYERDIKMNFDNYKHKTPNTSEENKIEEELVKAKSKNVNLGDEIITSENHSNLEFKTKSNSNYSETFGIQK